MQEAQEILPEYNEAEQARNALRSFVNKEKSGEFPSGHFLQRLTLKDGFDDAQVPDEDVVIFWKAYKREITDEEFESYRKKFLNEQGWLKSDINPSRGAVLQYVNNMVLLMRGRKSLEAERRRLQAEKNEG